MWNRIAALMVLVTAASLLITPIEAEARAGGGGGGRGGGGRGGGAYRGGQVMNRTPTMSRASSTQTRQFQARPFSQGRAQQGRQALQQRPSAAANRAELRNQVNRYVQARPTQNIDSQALAQKAQDFSSKRGNQITQNRQLSDRVNQRLQQSRPDSNHWFDRNFFDRHNSDVDYAGTGSNWWSPAAWTTLATWGAWNWSTPYYYDDGGYNYPVTTDESAYASPYSTNTEPYQPVENAQTTATTGGDWLPLGVFAVASNASAAALTNRFIQLAINRSGEIAGVLYNSATDATHDLIGMVDPNSQKAYWSLADRTDSPIASTGIYNLTEDQTPINVHFADGSDQTWTLVRLQQGK